MDRVIPDSEVAKHNKETDLWLVIKGNVHDLTNFIKEHPGGEEVLIAAAGMDATVCFEEIGHSTEAYKLCDNYKIGVLSGELPMASSAAVKKSKTEDDEDWHYDPPNYETSPWLPWIVAAGAIIYAPIFYYMFY